MSHWTQDLARPTQCIRCGKPLGNDKRRRYCGYGCYLDAQRDYHRNLKRQLRATDPEALRRREREYRQSPHGKAVSRRWAMRRGKLLQNARVEARERGVPARQILLEWKADVGQVRS